MLVLLAFSRYALLVGRLASCAGIVYPHRKLYPIVAGYQVMAHA